MKNIEEYLKIYDTYMENVYKIPYVYEIKEKTKILSYFGCDHDTNIKNEQFQKLKISWERFLKRTGGINVVVIDEGGTASNYLTERQAVGRSGASGLIRYLAKKNGIEVRKVEPSRNEVLKILLPTYPKDLVEYFFFAQIVYQWGITKPGGLFESYAKFFLKRDSEKNGWVDFDFSLENMKNIHKRIFKGEFDERDTGFFSAIVSPASRSTVINEISRKTTLLRDVKIVTNILEFWEQGTSIFIVYGASHAIIQEDALRTLLHKK